MYAAGAHGLAAHYGQLVGVYNEFCVGEGSCGVVEDEDGPPDAACAATLSCWYNYRQLVHPVDAGRGDAQRARAVEGGFVVRRSKLSGERNVGRVGRLSRIARGSAGSGRGQDKQARWTAAGVKQLRLRLDACAGEIGGQVQVAVAATMQGGRRCAYTAAQPQRMAAGRVGRICNACSVEREGRAGDGVLLGG